ncbi:hypothetical protein P7K49_008427, partial [Saguinus oedipus]
MPSPRSGHQSGHHLVPLLRAFQASGWDLSSRCDTRRSGAAEAGTGTAATPASLSPPGHPRGPFSLQSLEPPKPPVLQERGAGT